MEELIVKFANQILAGNIVAIFITFIVILAIIIYLIFQIINHQQNNQIVNNDATLDANDVLIQSMLYKIKEDLETLISLKHTEINIKLDQIESQFLNSINALERTLTTLSNTNIINMQSTVSSTFNSSINTLQNHIDKDLVDIRIQRNDIKNTININIKEIYNSIESLESNNNKILEALTHLKSLLELAAILNNNIKLSPLKNESH